RRQSRRGRRLFAQTPCIRFEIGHLSGRLKADFHSDQMELAMRTVVVVFAALMTLGLVAFGVVVVQKGSDPVALTKATAGWAPPKNEVAKSEKAPLDLGEAVKAAAPFISTAGAQNFPAHTPALRPACNNPDALGLSRVIEIDATGGPAFGTEHFKQYDFLRDKEVVLTFDDGPWPGNTPIVLKALQDNCTKATFFEIGEHATWR